MTVVITEETPSVKKQARNPTTKLTQVLLLPMHTKLDSSWLLMLLTFKTANLCFMFLNSVLSLVIFRPYNNDDLTDFLVGQRSNVFKLDSIKQTIQVFEDNKVYLPSHCFDSVNRINFQFIRLPIIKLSKLITNSFFLCFQVCESRL